MDFLSECGCRSGDIIIKSDQEAAIAYLVKDIVLERGDETVCRTIVEELFLGRWQSQVRCLVCGHESNTYESFATLPLDIGQVGLGGVARTVDDQYPHMRERGRKGVSVTEGWQGDRQTDRQTDTESDRQQTYKQTYKQTVTQRDKNRQK